MRSYKINYNLHFLKVYYKMAFKVKREIKGEGILSKGYPR
jgi:hypothetical protein